MVADWGGAFKAHVSSANGPRGASATVFHWAWASYVQSPGRRWCHRRPHSPQIGRL